jgi:hypothetical protein
MLAVSDFLIVGCLDPTYYTDADEEKPYGWKGMVPHNTQFDIIDADLDDSIANTFLKHFGAELREHGRLVHVITFKNDSSWGFEWYTTKEKAGLAFEVLCKEYTTKRRTSITQFTVMIPETRDTTEYLYKSDIYGRSNIAPKRRIVGV